MIGVVIEVVGARERGSRRILKLDGRSQKKLMGEGWVGRGGGEANLCMFSGFHGVGTRMKIYTSRACAGVWQGGRTGDGGWASVDEGRGHRYLAMGAGSIAKPGTHVPTYPRSE